MLTLFFCSSVWAETSVAPLKERTTDEQIKVDQQVFSALEARLEALNLAGFPVDSYIFTKASKWLEFAFDEYTDNDKMGIVEDALYEATYLTRLMEGGALNIISGTPLGSASMKIRNDLWDRVAVLKEQAGFSCGGAKVAELEVMLVWAGHEYKELGFQHAMPYIEKSEQLAREASVIVSSCKSSPSSAPAVAVHPLKATTTPLKRVLAQEVKKLTALADRVHFALGQSSMSRKTRVILDQMASILKTHLAIRVALHGHTDKRGSVKYNMALSKRRAEAVQSYWVEVGIAKERLTIVAHGEKHPTVMTQSKKGYAKNRRVGFFFENGGEIERIRQEKDIQIERTKHKKRGRRS